MQYRELTTRVVQAGLGVVTFSEEPTSDNDDSADHDATREHADLDSADHDATREHADLYGADHDEHDALRERDEVAYRASLPTLLENDPRHRRS